MPLDGMGTRGGYQAPELVVQVAMAVGEHDVGGAEGMLGKRLGAGEHGVGGGLGGQGKDYRVGNARREQAPDVGEGGLRLAAAGRGLDDGQATGGGSPSTSV